MPPAAPQPHPQGVLPIAVPVPSSLLIPAPLRSQIPEEDGNNYRNANKNSGMLMRDTIKGSRAFIPGNIPRNAGMRLRRAGEPAGLGKLGMVGRAPLPKPPQTPTWNPSAAIPRRAQREQECQTKVCGAVTPRGARCCGRCAPGPCPQHPSPQAPSTIHHCTPWNAHPAALRGLNRAAVSP